MGVWQTMMVDHYKNKMEIERAHGEYLIMMAKSSEQFKNEGSKKDLASVVDLDGEIQ